MMTAAVSAALHLSARHFCPRDFFADLSFEVGATEANTLSRLPVLALVDSDLDLPVGAAGSVRWALVCPFWTGLPTIVLADPATTGFLTVYFFAACGFGLIKFAARLAVAAGLVLRTGLLVTTGLVLTTGFVLMTGLL